MKKVKLLIAVLSILFLMAGMPIRAHAQDLSATRIPSLELDQADIRDALRALFKNVGISYVIAPDVQGTVTVSLKDIPFETGLQSILKQVDATYRVEGGVYSIIKRPETPVITAQNPDQGPLPQSTNKIIRKIYIMHADPAFIFAMLRGNTNLALTPEISKAAGGAGGGGIGGGGAAGGGGGGAGVSR